MNVDFIETGQISFNKISGDTVYYSTHDKELTLNLCFVKSLWDLEEINKNKKESTISALLDLNNDNILNAKDFAIINKNKNKNAPALYAGAFYICQYVLC